MVNFFRTSAKTIAPFLFAVGVFFLFVQLRMASILLEASLFAAACLLSCAFIPTHPFRAAFFGIAGVLAAAILDVIIHPLTSNGFERNLFPFEIAFHTGLAVPCFFAVALSWKGWFTLKDHDEENA